MLIAELVNILYLGSTAYKGILFYKLFQITSHKTYNNENNENNNFMMILNEV